MPKINQEEYEGLKSLDDKWKWIARDKDGTLVMGAGKNERYLDRWFPPVNVGDSIVVDETNAVKDVSEWENLFQFIQWEDESPYNIQELIEEYENSPEYVTYISTERTRILSNDLWSKLESEETEVKKNIEWLKDEILTDMRYLEGNREIRQLDIKYQTLREVAQKINSLDEPEVLSQEWIDEHRESTFDLDEDFETVFVRVRNLQNLLVPKQEEVDQAYKDGYEKGRELGFYKGYREGLGNKGGEPEVLSQEWIDENKSSWTKLKIDGYYIPVEKLQNLLVPKQELPVIPKFVADWIESRKNNYPSDVIGVYLRMNELYANEQTREVLRWVHESKLNRGSFARAWLDGYTIEQEPKYYAKIKGHKNIGSNDKYWNYNTDMEELSVGDNEVHPNVISEYILKATKDEWANLGITDDNADFVLVEEMEE